MRKIRLNQEPLGLINSLNSQGQGIQKYILKNLKKIQNKTLIFAGEKDEKYIKYSYEIQKNIEDSKVKICLLYTSPSPRDGLLSRMPSSA